MVSAKSLYKIKMLFNIFINCFMILHCFGQMVNGFFGGFRVVIRVGCDVAIQIGDFFEKLIWLREIQFLEKKILLGMIQENLI